MRSIHFTIAVCVLSIFVHSGSCGFFGDVIRQGLRTTLGIVRDIPNRIPSPNKLFEMTKNALIGVPLELTFDVIHEFCKYSTAYTHTFLNSVLPISFCCNF